MDVISGIAISTLHVFQIFNPYTEYPQRNMREYIASKFHNNWLKIVEN